MTFEIQMRFDKRDFSNPSASFFQNVASPLGVMRVIRPEAGEDHQVFDTGAHYDGTNSSQPDGIAMGGCPAAVACLQAQKNVNDV
jgi:hypothetical protein